MARVYRMKGKDGLKQRRNSKDSRLRNWGRVISHHCRSSFPTSGSSRGCHTAVSVDSIRWLWPGLYSSFGVISRLTPQTLASKVVTKYSFLEWEWSLLKDCSLGQRNLLIGSSHSRHQNPDSNCNLCSSSFPVIYYRQKSLSCESINTSGLRWWMIWMNAYHRIRTLYYLSHVWLSNGMVMERCLTRSYRL